MHVCMYVSHNYVVLRVVCYVHKNSIGIKRLNNTIFDVWLPVRNLVYICIYIYNCHQNGGRSAGFCFLA